MTTPLDIAVKALERIASRSYSADLNADIAVEAIAAIAQQASAVAQDDRSLFYEWRKTLTVEQTYRFNSDGSGYKIDREEYAGMAFQAGRASAAVAGEAVRWGLSSSVSLGCKATPHSVEETEARVKTAIANGTVVRMEGDFNIVINGAEHESPWWVICQHGFTYKFTQPPFSAQAVRDQALEEAAVAVEDVHDWTGSDGRSVSPPQEFCAEAVRALKSQPAPQGEK